MSFPRPLATLVAALCLLLWAAPAGADDSGGGVAFQSVPSFEGSGGGIAAPVPEPATEPAPRAEAAQEQTPTTPEGEKQPPDEEGPPDEEIPDEETPAPDDTAGGGGGGGPGGGSLPRTGLELAALSAIGLGLLLAGGALWPTSSWPPARGRPTR
jgi:hypothetical protein